MKLGKPHLIVSLTMVAASIAYNVWVFARPARPGAPASGPSLIETVAASGPVVTGDEPAPAIDPATVAPPPDVDLSNAPEWPRNPFAGRWPQRREASIVPVAQVESEPELAVTSILHSADRQLAVVNGKIVRAGDRLGSSTIVEIQPRAIVVESPGGARRRVELRVASLTRVAARADVK